MIRLCETVPDVCGYNFSVLRQHGSSFGDQRSGLDQKSEVGGQKSEGVMEYWNSGMNELLNDPVKYADAFNGTGGVAE